MISKQRLKVILDLALPLMLGLSSSLIMAVINLSFVGSLGAAAVAAVGLAGFTYAILCALLNGVTPAVQAVVSRRIGERSTEPKCLPLNAGVAISLVTGIVVTGVSYWLVEWYFSWLSPDPEVAKAGVPYLRALILGMTFSGIASAFQGFWAGLGKTRAYMFNIIFVNVLNVFLCYTFVFGHFGFPPMGTLGAGLATMVAVMTSALCYFLLTFVNYRHEGLLTARPTKALVVRMLRISIPAVMEAGFFAIGYLVFYWIVGRMGTPDLAAVNVLTRVSFLTNLIAMALGTTAVTLVSRTMGEGNPDGAERWGWDVAKVGVISITVFCLPLIVFPDYCLSFFLHDPAIRAIANVPMQLTGLFLGLASLIYIFAATLISVGEGKRVLLVSFLCQWLIFLPGVWIVGVNMHGGLIGITLVQLVYGAIATSFIVAIWHQGRWKTIKHK